MLMRRCNLATRRLRMGLGSRQSSLLEPKLFIAPAQEPFEIAQQRYCQVLASLRTLGSGDLAEHHLHASLGSSHAICRFPSAALAFG